MKILVFGYNGQVATELRSLTKVIALKSCEADFLKPKTCVEAIRRIQPDIIINAAAYTQVDTAEVDKEIAYIINAITPGIIAEECAKNSIPLIHISSDYVFSGIGHEPWKPTDIPSPLNSYGRSKMEGENLIISSKCQYVVLRTSWVFSNYGSNFVKNMIKLAQANSNLKVVDDQFGGPTSARSIAKACLIIAQYLTKDKNIYGIHHFAGTPNVSWFEFAQDVFKELGWDILISGISSDRFKTQADRPKNSRLDCTSTLHEFGIKQSNWRQELRYIISERRL